MYFVIFNLRPYGWKLHTVSPVSRHSVQYLHPKGKLYTTTKSYILVITSRNEVVAKVMFLLVSVILSTGEGGVCLSACWDTTPPAKETPLPRRPPHREADSGIRSMSGRYASYWNAFLYYMAVHKINMF